jgi:hypothetical protein
MEYNRGTVIGVYLLINEMFTLTLTPGANVILVLGRLLAVQLRCH